MGFGCHASSNLRMPSIIATPTCFVTLKCFYEKLQGIELSVMQSPGAPDGSTVQAIVEELGATLPPLLPITASRFRRQRAGRQAASHQGIAFLGGRAFRVRRWEFWIRVGLIVDIFPARRPAQDASLLEGRCWPCQAGSCDEDPILHFGLHQRGRGSSGRDFSSEHKGLPWRAKRVAFVVHSHRRSVGARGRDRCRSQQDQAELGRC